MKKQFRKNQKEKGISRRKLVLGLLSILLLGLVVWTVWGNVTVGLTEIVVEEENLPGAFDGFRIAQVSDLHNCWLWEQTLERLRDADPDIIVITGDLVDANRPDVELALNFMLQAVQIADCFYVPGNHEAGLDPELYAQLIEGMEQYGVYVMNDSETVIHKNGAYISIVGHGWNEATDLSQVGSFDGYRILLSHWPEKFEEYEAAGFELVFSGHVHGGQVRLPFVGALYGPGQGYFPEYDAGLYSSGDTDMVVSRGIGNSRFRFRFNNQPEVVVVELRCK